MADRPQLVIRPGYQEWLVVRTDRDGASVAEVVESLGSFLQFALSDVRGAQADSSFWELFEVGERQWRVSGARPVVIIDGPSQQAMVARGDVWQDRQALDVLPTLGNSKNPWYVRLGLWWRATEATVDWPSARQGWFGREWSLENAAFLLLTSSAGIPPAEDPSDATWGEAQQEHAVDLVKKVALPAAWIVGGLAVVSLAVILGMRTKRAVKR